MMNGIFTLLFALLCGTYHPLYLSVVDVLHNAETKSIEVITKTYTDDLEKAIKTKYNLSVDLLNEKNKAKNNEVLEMYVKDHLQVLIENKALFLKYVGYEKNEASIWCYFEVENQIAPSKIHIATNLLFEISDKQNNILHTTVNNERKTKRLAYPETNAIFEW